MPFPDFPCRKACLDSWRVAFHLACAHAGRVLVLVAAVGWSGLLWPTGASAQMGDPSAVILPGQADAREEQAGWRSSIAPEVSAPVRASGGLPPGPQERVPGERYFTASQTQANERQVLREEELARFAVDDDALTTGSVDDGAPQPIRPAVEETDPYDPVGVRTGPLTWFPAIDLAIGYDSNVDSDANARQVRTLRLSPELRVESDWRRHAWTGSLRGSLDYVDDGRDLGHTLAVESTLRLDLGLETTAALRGGYALTGEAANDANAATGADGTTDTHDLTAGMNLTRTFGPVEATLGLSGRRVTFSDTQLAGGGVQSNGDRARNEGSLTLRLQQAAGPIARPFVEGTLGLRRFDERIDRNGFERDSFGYGLRGGIALDDGGPVSGEASVGFVGERFADSALDDVLALSLAAELTWDVTALTSVTLDVATTLDPTTQAGSGVGINRAASLSLTHDLRRNVELRLGAGVDDTRFSGIDADSRTYSGTAGITWRASPVVAFRLDTTFEHEPSSTGDINRFAAEAGVTLRR